MNALGLSRRAAGFRISAPGVSESRPDLLVDSKIRPHEDDAAREQLRKVKELLDRARSSAGRVVYDEHGKELAIIPPGLKES
jgi:hypothetical protein